MILCIAYTIFWRLNQFLAFAPVINRIVLMWRRIYELIWRYNLALVRCLLPNRCQSEESIPNSSDILISQSSAYFCPHSISTCRYSSTIRVTVFQLKFWLDFVLMQKLHWIDVKTSLTRSTLNVGNNPSLTSSEFSIFTSYTNDVLSKF